MESFVIIYIFYIILYGISFIEFQLARRRLVYRGAMA